MDKSNIIIGFHGPKGSGKNFVADALAKSMHPSFFEEPIKQFEVCAFADPLREFILDVFDMDVKYSQGYLKEVPVWRRIPSYDHILAACIHYFGNTLPAIPILDFVKSWHGRVRTDKLLSYRQYMVGIGTEVVRNKVSPDFWLDLLAAKKENLIVNDVRLDNEADLVRDRGILVHISNPDVDFTGEHSTEQGVKFDPMVDILYLNDTSKSATEFNYNIVKLRDKILSKLG